MPNPTAMQRLKALAVVFSICIGSIAVVEAWEEFKKIKRGEL
jgi:hypothetical protein